MLAWILKNRVNIFMRKIIKTQNIEKDIREIKFGDLLKYYTGADIKVLVGCAPCQPFSSHTRRTFSGEKDFSLVKEFIRLIKEGKPDIISMENVPGLMRYKVFNEFIETLDDLGYKHCHEIVSCFEYGIPQKRKRLVLLASKLGNISLVAPIKKRAVVADYLKQLPQIDNGQQSSDDSAHVAIRLTDMNLERIKQSKPGGTWKDWEAQMICKCHEDSYYPASYGRMQWDAPAPTITTQFCYYSTGRFGHPEQNRAISVREAALLQTFPNTYKFSQGNKPIVVREMAKYIGNAVPVKLAEVIGTSIIKSVYA